MNWTKTVLRIDKLQATWTDLERESGVSRRTFYNWHHGRGKKPDAHKVKALLEALDRLERQKEKAK